MSTQQASLGEFDPPTSQEPEDENDGLQAIAAGIVTGFSVTQAREARSHDRVVSEANCRRCGAPHDGGGICEECRTQGDLLDDPALRSIGGGES